MKPIAAIVNRFQLAMQKNKALIKRIVLLYHPAASQKQLANLVVFLKNDWVCIKGFHIAIGIEITHGQWSVQEGYTTLASFQELVNNNQLIIKAWRFYDDSLYRDGAVVTKDGDNCPRVHELIMDAGIPLPTAEELYEYFYYNN